MKKPILLIASLCAAACCLGACGSTNKNEYSFLNDMLDVCYSKVTLTVTDALGDEDITLESKYEISYSSNVITIEYKVERLAEISLDNPSAELKTVYQGTATITNGVVSGGQDAGITVDTASTGITFNPKYFDNAILTNMSFKADVVNTSAFMGAKISCDAMKVEALFMNDRFYDISIAYVTTDGDTVQYKYEFSR